MFVFRSICVILAIAYVNGSEIREFFVDQGQNLTLPCALKGDGEIMWVREGREDKQVERLTIQHDGSLFLQEVNRNDTGLYSCFVDDAHSDNETRSKVRVKVRTPPPALSNVTIHPSTILALILWEVKDNGGYPIIKFTAEYKLAASDEDWKPISPNHISPNSRQIDVYKLEPNTTYAFRIWATNQLGQGDITEVESKTLKVYEEIELARHFLAGAEKFDTRVWVAAVGIVMGTLTLLGIGTCYLLYLECRVPSTGEQNDEQEIIELVPNIILNPGFEDNTQHTEHIPADENSNNETAIRLNNNTVVQPRNV
ncbi:uncharacterized protein CBL_14431 [Carabus blaptoides fortunei]